MKKNKEYSPRTIPEGKSQININLPIDLITAIDSIAKKENESRTILITKAVEKYIRSYNRKRKQG